MSSIFASSSWECASSCHDVQRLEIRRKEGSCIFSFFRFFIRSTLWKVSSVLASSPSELALTHLIQVPPAKASRWASAPFSRLFCSRLLFRQLRTDCETLKVLNLSKLFTEVLSDTAPNKCDASQQRKSNHCFGDLLPFKRSGILDP